MIIKHQMQNDIQFSENNNSSNPFPSTGFVIVVYLIGAILSLTFAFHTWRHSLQSTNCMIIGWFLALAALGMSILSEEDPEEFANDES